MKTKELRNYLILGAVAAAGVWYVKKQGVAAVKAAGNAINPVNPDNIFYGGVNSVGSALSGNDGFSLGVWTYELIHGED